MKYIFICTLLLRFIYLPFSSFSQEDDWQLKKDSDGIRVYTRSVENSNIKEFKAATNITSSAETVFNIILEIENYPKWIENVEFGEKLYQRENEIGMYYQMGLPWPIQNRDITLISKFRKLPDGSFHFKLNNGGDLKEEDANFIRINEINGQWLIEPIDDTNCTVIYQFLADPEGSLPAWAINLFIVDSPYATLQNLELYARERINSKDDIN